MAVKPVIYTMELDAHASSSKRTSETVALRKEKSTPEHDSTDRPIQYRTMKELFQSL